MPTFFLDQQFSGPSVDMARFLEFDSESFDPLTSYFLLRLPYLESGGTIEVQAQWERRPDLVSYHIYGTTQWWWIILMYNDLTTNEEVKAGDRLDYPTTSAIDTYLISAKKRSAFTRCKNLRISSMAV